MAIASDVQRKITIDPTEAAKDLLALASLGLAAAPQSSTAAAVGLGLRIGGRLVALVEALAEGVETEELTVGTLDERVAKILAERGIATPE